MNFPVSADDPYRIDVEETKKLIEEYRPELIIFGKSMVIYREPVREISEFIKDMGLDTTIMYDMAHVLGLIGDNFQKPFEEGADLVTGSTHKTFFGPQRGVIGGNWERAIQSMSFGRLYSRGRSREVPAIIIWVRSWLFLWRLTR